MDSGSWVSQGGVGFTLDAGRRHQEQGCFIELAVPGAPRVLSTLGPLVSVTGTCVASCCLTSLKPLMCQTSEWLHLNFFSSV